MKYNFDIAHQAGVKYQTANELSQLPTEGMEDSDINEYIPIMASVTSALKRLSEVTNKTLYYTHIETNEPQFHLSTS